MSDLQIAQRITANDLIRLDSEDQRFEVIRGQLIELPQPGIRHHEILGNIYMLLTPFVRSNRLGYVMVEENEILQLALVPDLSFIRTGCFPKDFDRERPFPGAPDLAVEVISPTESAGILQEKINSYQAHRTQQIWVVYPEQEVVHVYDREQPDQIAVYHESDVLESPALFPGLQINVADFFVLQDFEE